MIEENFTITKEEAVYFTTLRRFHLYLRSIGFDPLQLKYHLDKCNKRYQDYFDSKNRQAFQNKENKKDITHEDVDKYFKEMEDLYYEAAKKRAEEKPIKASQLDKMIKESQQEIQFILSKGDPKIKFGIEKEPEFEGVKKEDKIKIELEISQENEGTYAPYWVIIDPENLKNSFIVTKKSGGVPSREQISKYIAFATTGLFFSREAAENYLAANHYNFSKHAIVWCLSGHASYQYTLAIQKGEKEFISKKEPIDHTKLLAEHINQYALIPEDDAKSIVEILFKSHRDKDHGRVINSCYMKIMDILEYYKEEVRYLERDPAFEAKEL